MANKRKPTQPLTLEQEHADHPDDQYCPGCAALKVACSRIDDLEDILRMRFSELLSEQDINGVILGAVIGWALNDIGAGAFNEPYRTVLRDIETRVTDAEEAEADESPAVKARSN